VLSGDYIVEMEVVDDNIGVPQYNEFKIKVANHKGQKVILGDILLFGALYDFARVDYRQLLPAPNNICRSDFTVVSEAVLLDSIQNISAVAAWYSKNREIRKGPMIIAQDREKLTLFLAYPIKELQPGQFTLQIRLTGRNMKPQTVEMPIEVVKQILFYSEENLNQAIEQMRYIGEGASWDSLKDASDYEKKQYWFTRFWQDYYPTVDSMNNPVQEEYFRRVQFTNREFGNGMEGWRTDRGRIFLIYGQPDEVQESVNAMMRNYQIWTYQKLKKQFIFIDEHGNGYYRLTQEL